MAVEYTIRVHIRRLKQMFLHCHPYGDRGCPAAANFDPEQTPGDRYSTSRDDCCNICHNFFVINDRRLTELSEGLIGSRYTCPCIIVGNNHAEARRLTVPKIEAWEKEHGEVCIWP